MILSCETCRELLALHADDSSESNGVLPAEVLSHLESCAMCSQELVQNERHEGEMQREYSNLRSIVAELRSLPLLEAPADLRERVRSQIASENIQSEGAQKNAATKNRSKLPRFSISRPIIPRWATYSLPSVAVAACLLLLLWHEPDPMNLSASRQAESSAETSDAPAAVASRANSTDATKQAPQSSRKPNRTPNRTPGRGAKNEVNASADGFSISQKPPAPSNAPSSLSAPVPAPATPERYVPSFVPRPKNAPPNRDSSYLSPALPRQITKSIRQRAVSKGAPLASPSASAGAQSREKLPTPLSARQTDASPSAPNSGRLFARLETERENNKRQETIQSRADLRFEYSRSRERGYSPDDATENRSRDGEQASEETTKQTTKEVNSSSNAASTRSAPQREDNRKSASESASENFAPNGAGSAADEDSPDSVADSSSATSTRSNAPSMHNAPRSRSSASESSGAGASANAAKSRMPKPVAPPVPAAPSVAPDADDSDVPRAAVSPPQTDSKTASDAINPSANKASSSAPARGLNRGLDSSTRTPRVYLVLSLPKTSAKLRVQIRWPGGTTQTVWSGRGTRGQELKLEVAPPTKGYDQNSTSRNKIRRAQVSVQEAAPFLPSSRAQWKTIARQDISW